MEVEKKGLNDLRVVDLKRELEKRGLDKTGVKAVLTERLSKAIEEEGLSAETHLFELDDGRGSVKGDDLDKSNVDDTNESIHNETQESDVEEKNSNINQVEDESKDNNEDEALLSINGENYLLGHDDDEEGGAEAEENLDNDQDVPEEYLSVHDDDGADFSAVDESEIEKKDNDADAEDKGEETAVPGDTNDTEEGDVIKKEPEGDEANAESGVDGEADGGAKDPAADTSQGQASATDDDKKKDGKSGVGANLWVSNLSSLTKATDLKRLFSRHGKLVGAKIVTSARTPGARCYGYITMANTDDADRCIEFLHRVELHGRLISVERAKDDATGPLRTAQPREHTASAKSDADRERVPKSQTVPKRSPSRRSPRQDVLSFSKIKEERERQRRRDYERRAREMAKIRRDQEEEMRNRERQRRQRIESERLEKEKQRLRMEREKLEREKDQLLRLERNRQRMERERLERERDEIRNRKKRLEERPPPRAMKRPADDKRPLDYGGKRPAADKDDLMLEPPPPPRFNDQERARDRSRRDDKRPSTRRDEFRHASPQSHQRYSREKERRSGKDDVPRDARSGGRYETSKDKNWQGNGTQYKAYTASTGGGSAGGGSGYARDVWVAARQDWGGENSARWQADAEGLGARAYATAALYGSAAYAQPSPPGVAAAHARYGDPRFDAYAHSMPVRKY